MNEIVVIDSAGQQDTVVSGPDFVSDPALSPDGTTLAIACQSGSVYLSHGDGHVATGLKAIVDADPTFSPKAFLEGAKQAYEMIVTAYAAGDRKTLKPLLEKDVYDGFDKAIADREAAGRKIDFTFVGLPKIEISEAEIDKRDARLAVKFNAEVVQATKDKDGTIIEGDAEKVQTIADE